MKAVAALSNNKKSLRRALPATGAGKNLGEAFECSSAASKVVLKRSRRAPVPRTPSRTGAGAGRPSHLPYDRKQPHRFCQGSPQPSHGYHRSSLGSRSACTLGPFKAPRRGEWRATGPKYSAADTEQVARSFTAPSCLLLFMQTKFCF